jgi:hypothetical protein
MLVQRTPQWTQSQLLVYGRVRWEPRWLYLKRLRNLSSAVRFAWRERRCERYAVCDRLSSLNIFRSNLLQPGIQRCVQDPVTKDNKIEAR